MSHIASRTAAAVTLLVLMSAGLAGAQTPRVNIRIYDASLGPRAARAAAVEAASAIVNEAGVEADWRDCTDDGLASSCQASREVRDVIVRIMPSAPGGLPFGGSAIASRPNIDESSLRLGLAIVDPGTRVGSMVTLYYDHVTTVARRAGIDVGELLGRALAHELGHLLLGISGHSPTGLMRAIWTDAELRANRQEDFLFAPLDRRRLQRDLLVIDEDEGLGLALAEP